MVRARKHPRRHREHRDEFHDFGRVIYFTSPLDRALGRNRRLHELLGGEIRVCWGTPAQNPANWLGWGRKPSGRRACRLAQKHKMGYLLLEDGFLRSIGFGPDEPAYSLVADDLGVYYDATGPSRLEALIPRKLGSAGSRRAAEIAALWRENRVSKYNRSREYTGLLPKKYVLVADQTAGDASICLGLACHKSFQEMLEAALDENPGWPVLLKIHPEVLAGRKKGHFDLNSLRRNDRIQILGADAHPVRLIESAQAVYTVTSQMGFEALLWGKSVRVFGMPFYAGWGFTRDEKRAPARRSPVAIENLVHATLVAYSLYLDPETNKRCEPERLIEWMGFQRRMRARFPERVTACGFSSWKHSSLRAFLAGSRVTIRRCPRRMDIGGALAVWPGNYQPADPRKYSSVLRLEDGFVRSVGLGAELVKPLSWVIDSRGIYYDAKSVSDLEHILQHTEFPPDLVLRARRLRERIVAGGVTKYNVDSMRWKRPFWAEKTILVVGQVETDASIRHGTNTIRSNMDLLRAVRQSHPEACVIYKPHPDVVAGLRLKGAAEEQVHLWCNDIVTGCSLPELFETVDEIHVMTSLTGFEALLREKPVVTYGQPFYAGWGLTTDLGISHAVSKRRSRSLHLDELVAATLILYPTYISRISGAFTTPEQTLEEISAWRSDRASEKKQAVARRLNSWIGRIFAN